MNIDVEKYLSEEQKEQIAIQEWRKIIHRDMVERFKGNHTKAVDNYERVISNAVYNYLEDTIDSIIGKDHKKEIARCVKKVISESSVKYSLFRKQNAWDRERSPAQEALVQAVRKYKDILEEKVKEGISELSAEDMVGGIDEILTEIIKDKFK